MASYANLLRESRVHAWNVEFLDRNFNVFAGVFQHEDQVLYGDVFNELSWAFDFKGAGIDEAELSLWRHDDAADRSVRHRGECDEEVLPSPAGPEELFQFVVAHHSPQTCRRRDVQDVAIHAHAGCARMVSPVRGQRLFYLPINKKSDDPLVASFPCRRRSASPRKRSSSGSASPQKDAPYEEDNNAIAPRSIQAGQAKTLMASFRDLTLLRGRCCAITGVGKPWSNGIVRPAIEACHIVPQIHYNVYPLSMDDLDPALGPAAEQQSPSKLEEQWSVTWSTDNGICLASHVHELYDSRLVSINPRTFKIRAFAPYDMVLPYHGKPAFFRGSRPSTKALEHHWRVTCIENMAAKYPDPLSPPSPAVSRQELASTLTPPIRETGEEVPTKKRQLTLGRPSSSAVGPGRGNLPPPDTEAAEGKGEAMESTYSSPGNSDPVDIWEGREDPGSSESDNGTAERPAKRLRRELGEEQGQSGGWDKFITGRNHKQFLADVDWELRHWT